MPFSIHSYATVTFNKDVVIVGGFSPQVGEVGTIARLNTSGEWELLGRLMEPRSGHSVSRLTNQRFMVIGGEGLRKVEIHTISDDTDPVLGDTVLHDYKFYPELISVEDGFCK